MYHTFLVHAILFQKYKKELTAEMPIICVLTFSWLILFSIDTGMQSICDTKYWYFSHFSATLHVAIRVALVKKNHLDFDNMYAPKISNKKYCTLLSILLQQLITHTSMSFYHSWVIQKKWKLCCLATNKFEQKVNNLMEQVIFIFEQPLKHKQFGPPLSDVDKAIGHVTLNHEPN